MSTVSNVETRLLLLRLRIFTVATNKAIVVVLFARDEWFTIRE